jgi:hypothetical protein
MCVCTQLDHQTSPHRFHRQRQDKLLSVGERFPVVNGLLNAIRRKKSKVGGG